MTAPSDATTAPCQACESWRQRPLSGLYRFQCVECCARLVLSAHPSKQQAAAMLAAIERFPESPMRSDILARVRQKLEKPA